MVELMDNYSLSEGLFLKSYLGTVSAVPRTRTAAYTGTKSILTHGEYPHKKSSHSVEKGMFNHAKITHELGVKSESIDESRMQQQSEIIERNAVELKRVIQVENDDDKGKKKEKKWTFGGFFKRKSKKDADDSSEESGEENRKGFLSRRKSKRGRRKFKSRTNTNGFDVVILQPIENAKNGEISVEQLWSDGLKSAEPNSRPQRYISRHSDICKTNNTPLVPKHSRRDSNFSRSSGGSETTEAKINRKEVMARAEAKRDMLQDDSSSDEYESYRSTSSLNRLNNDCRKLRRTERYKRSSKDENVQRDLRMIKSDFEGVSPLPFKCRLISKTYYPESNDHEGAKLNLVNHSRNSSPCKNPPNRKKQFLHYRMMSSSYPTSTFPPGGHGQHSRYGSLGLSSSRNNDTKENQPLVSYRNLVVANKNVEYSLSKNLSISDNSNRQKLVDYEQFKNFYGSTREKSLSYDQNINRASCFENESEISKESQQENFDTAIKYERFTDDGKRVDIYNRDPQVMVKTCSKVIENRINSPSPQSGTFPQKSTQILRNSEEGNSPCKNVRKFNPDYSISYQNIPSFHGCCSQLDTPQLKSFRNNTYCNLPPSLESAPAQKFHMNGTSILRYYADQNPRSRNPIHITCNFTASEQPYLSDSQMIVKSVQSVRNSASDFWKLKDKESMMRQENWENSLRPLPTQSSPWLNKSRSNSPKLTAITKALAKPSENAINEFRSKPLDSNVKKVLQKESNTAKLSAVPPEPPVRKLSKQEVLTRLQKCEQIKKQENEIKKSLQDEGKVHCCYNLDDALNELEMIYNSLRLKDDDLADRAERRDLPVFRPKSPTISVSVRDKIQNFFAETDFFTNSESTIPIRHQRAIPLRRSGIPDKLTDDMAFRRLNQKSRIYVKKLPSQSYLRSSPALSPVRNVCLNSRKECTVLEPDITYDDVVYRNIRHANSTLKIQDPQPPFGIPIGVITPAPNSDYLHAMPTERFRPTFTSSKTPDVIKDDLAFRNLRKDNKMNTCLESNKSELKKRAVRSLSANFYNIMQKDSSDFVSLEENNMVIFDKNREKTQSLTDLTKGRLSLEKRLRELKEVKSEKRTEFFELPQEERKEVTLNLSLTNLASEVAPITEFQKTGFHSNIEDSSKKFKSPVIELSKFPAAAPSSSFQGNPFKESSFVDDDQLDNLLSALAKEAEDTSKDLEKELDRLDVVKATFESNNASVVDDKSKTVEELDKKFSLLNRTKRKRNLSLSNTNESKEEIRKTVSLERKGKSDKNELSLTEVFRNKTDEMNFVGKADKCGEAKLGSENNISKSVSSCGLDCKEQERSQSFEIVTDLSEILKDVEVSQHLSSEITLKETNSVFQEVYEYNCKFSAPVEREIRGGIKSLKEIREMSRTTNMISDVETEFEKLHEEVNGTKKTKETEFAQVDDLMADITSVDQSSGDSYSSFPFPKDSESPSGSGMFSHRNETSPRSGKGEGEAKKASLDNNVWLACSYALAFAFHLQEIDFLTALGLVLAVISVVAILIL